MKNRLHFGAALLAAASFAVWPAPGLAQKPHSDRPPQHQTQPQTHVAQPHPSQPHPPSPNANRPPSNTSHPGNRPPATNETPRANFNHPGNRPNGTSANLTPRQQLGVGAPRPWVDQMRDLSPQQRDRVLQDSRAFQNLSPGQQNKIRQQFNQWDRMSPQQRADQQIKEDNWRRMTPPQREHIKNDVLPKWKRMPWDRQQMMKQKLGVLQNMPESARNQRLNDPNFTKGMSDEEKAMLHDLSHTHVGGPPEPPSE